MRYSKDEAFKEIMNRGKAIRHKHDYLITTVLSISSMTCVIVMIAFIGIFARTDAETASMSYGAFILNAEAGQYVIFSLACFILGIVTVIVAKTIRRKARSLNR